MISREQLRKLNEINLDSGKKDGLVDIKKISVDTSLAKPDKISRYLTAVQNPYLFRVGEVAVQVRYGKGNSTLQESVVNFLAPR